MNTGGITDILINATVLGVEDNTLDGFSFYPNPTSDVVNLKATSTIDNVAIYNFLGQRVIEMNNAANRMELNVSNLATGTYIMKVSIGGEIGTYKVIKN
jgi:hypothetical protein